MGAVEHRIDNSQGSLCLMLVLRPDTDEVELMGNLAKSPCVAKKKNQPRFKAHKGIWVDSQGCRKDRCQEKTDAVRRFWENRHNEKLLRNEWNFLNIEDGPLDRNRDSELNRSSTITILRFWARC